MSAPKQLAWASSERYPDIEMANHMDEGYYTIIPITWTGETPRWRLSYRMDDIGDFTSPAEAKEVAAVHHAASHRKFLWDAYMAANDPPKGDGL